MESDEKPAQSKQGGRAIASPSNAPRDGYRLRLLGPLAATRRGLEIPMPASRKVRALLGYLALAPRPVLRAHLCELLWDVADDPRSELRWCLTKLRGVIDDEQRRRLVSDGQRISIVASDLDIDAITFSRAIEDALAQDSLADLKSLVGMIEGDLLEGLAVDRSPMFDNWLRGQRHRFANWHSRALARIASLLPDDGEEALAILRKRIDLSPLEEKAHIDLMRALIARGHVAEAEHHLATTVSLYQREGFDPKPLHDAWFGARRIRVRLPASAVVLPDDRRIPSSPLGDVSSRRASIAVMPFVGSTPGEQRLADGLTYDIIVGLCKLRSLLVIAQGTIFALRDRGISGPEAIGLLGADYVATGTVATEGSRIRISLQLCACDSGRILWANEYDSLGDDAIQAPGTIATGIVSCLEAEIQLAECNRAILKPPNSLDAWETHHRGLWHMHRFTGPDNEEAQRLFRRAIALDPTFSRAYAALSFVHWQNAFTFRPSERQAETDRAFDAAGRGLQADPRDPAAHCAMGRALWLRQEDGASLGALNEAVALSPSFAMAHYTRSFVEAQTGDAAAAVLASDLARQLSPFDPFMYAMCTARGFALVRLGRYEEAAEWAIRGSRKPNATVHVHACAALFLAMAGKLDQASCEVAAIRRLRSTYGIGDFFSSFRLVGDESRARVRAAAKQIGMG